MASEDPIRRLSTTGRQVVEASWRPKQNLIVYLYLYRTLRNSDWGPLRAFTGSEEGCWRLAGVCGLDKGAGI
jgi:hypothetical protein